MAGGAYDMAAVEGSSMEELLSKLLMVVGSGTQQGVC